MSTAAGRSVTRPSLAYIAICTAMSAVSLAIASVAFWPVYQSPRYLVVVAVSIVLGSALVVAGTLWRWPSFVVLLAGVVAFLAIGVPLAVPSKAISGVLPSLDGLVDLVAGVALGWKQLLTITIPVGEYEALLVPVGSPGTELEFAL